MTSPYGSDPNQPQGLGVPGARGPQFVPPSAPSTYGPPLVPPSRPVYTPPPVNPYGPPPGAYGTGPGYGQGPTFPPYPQFSPPPRRRASPWLIILVVVAVIAGAVVTYALARPALPSAVTQPTPTRPTSKATKSASPTSKVSTAPDVIEDCDSGQTVATSLFSATVPLHWACDGADGDISISSMDDDSIWAYHVDGVEGDADCRAQLLGMGTLEALPDEAWGSVTAHAYRSDDSGDVYGVRCAVVGNRTWYLVYYPNLSDDETSVKKTVSAFMRSWVWK